MSAKAQITGIDGIMDWFDRHATSPYYAVYTYRTPSKLDKSFQYTKPDIDEGRMLLENTLISMQQQDDQTLYCIKLYHSINKKNSVDADMAHDASLNFRVSEMPSMSSMQQITGVERSNYKTDAALAKLMETQNIILAKLSQEEFEEENEPEDKGVLGNILSSPQMQTLLVAGLSKLLGITDNDSHIAGIAGIDNGDPNEAILILNSLMSKGVSVDHLRKLDSMSNAKLQSLLLML